MLPRLAFYPTLLYNVVMEKVSSRQWYNRIDGTVILGALPFKSMTQKLVEEENVRGVVTLNEPYETRLFVNSSEEWRQWGVEQLCLDTKDLVAAPTQEKLHTGCLFLLHHRGAGHSVYVHCKAGRTRSTTLVACYLMKIHSWSPEDAVQFIRDKRPHIIIRQAQWDALHTFHRQNILNQS